MKRALLLATSLLIGSAFVHAEDYAPNQVIVKFRHGARRPALSFQAAPMKTFGIGKATERARRFTEAVEDYAVINLSPGTSVEDAIRALRARADIEYAGPNTIVHAMATPNDTFFSAQQWSLNNTGQTVNGNVGVADADIDAPEAWDLVTGSATVIVAVVDGSVDYTHPDLAANMWHNPGEINNDGIDNDGDGVIDDYYGANFVRVSGPPLGDPGSDGYFHGSHVAGIIGAATNNSQGIAGTAWGIKIMALRFLDSGGSGSISNATEAIQFATAHGASVINNSWATSSDDPLLHAAITAAYNAGIVITAAAGNDANSPTVYYPAAYSEVIAVSATTNIDRPILYNYGAHIDLGAPGRDIASTTPSNQYAFSTGTSMAAPHVAGVAALMKSVSSSITPDQTLTILKASVDVPTLWETFSTTTTWYGAGRLNAFNAVRSVGDVTAPSVLLTAPVSATTYNGTISLNATASDNKVLMKVWFMVDGVVISTDTTSPYSTNWNTALVSDGAHVITARAFDGAGNTASSSANINVGNSDTVIPAISITAPSGGTYRFGTISVNATATDNVGVSKVWFALDGVNMSTDTTFAYSWSFDTLTTTNGPHTITATAFDAVGNSSATAVSFNIANPDISSPTVTMTSPSSGVQLAGVFAISATASDNVGISTVQFFVDGVLAISDISSPYGGSINTLSYSTGSHVLSARAYDAAGNSSATAVTVSFIQDVSSPTVSITAPTTGVTLYGTTLISVTASDDIAVSTVQFLVDGVFLSSDTTAPYTATFSTINYSSGTHLIQVRAFDPSNNSTAVSVSVIFSPIPLDAGAPTISASGFAPGARLSGIVDLMAEASDDIGVIRVELLIDGTLVDSDATAPYAFKLNTSLFGTGAHVATLRAYDAAGNSTSTSIAFTVASFGVSAFQPLFNPMRGESVTIPLNLGETLHVEARLLDRFGSLVATLMDGEAGPGTSLTWDGRNSSRDVSASGTYLLYLNIAGTIETRKIILRK